MDLDKLKIEECKKTFSSFPSKMLIVAISLVVGILIGHFLPLEFSRAVEVRTAVVVPSSGNSGRQFICGGWVEAATPKYPVIMSAKISERIEDICVSKGDIVHPGQILIKFYDADLKIKLEIDKSERDVAMQRLEKVKSGYRKEDIKSAEAKLEEVKEKLHLAKATHDRCSLLIKQKAISEQSYDEAFGNLKQAEAAEKVLLSALEKMNSGYRKEDIAEAQANFERADSTYRLSQRNLEYCMVKVPDDSPQVLRVLDIFQQKGEYIEVENETCSLLSLYDPNDMQARADVPQSNIRFVKQGGKATIVTEAFPGKQYEGKVARIEPLATLSKNTIPVKVKIIAPDTMLFPEMIAKITFLMEDEAGEKSKDSGHQIPADAIFKKGTMDYVSLVEDGKIKHQPVNIVSSDAEGKTAIVANLSSGQRIAISDPGKLKEGTKVKEIK